MNDLANYKNQFFNGDTYKLYPEIPGIKTPKIFLEAREYESLFANVEQGMGRDYINFKKNSRPITFIFNTPSDFVENFTSNYEPYDSILQNLKEEVSRKMTEVSKSAQNFENYIQFSRVDAPLAYTGSDHRDISLVFEVSLFNDIEKTEKAIHVLKTIVMPSAVSQHTSGKVEPPALFTIYMRDGERESNLIYMRRALCRTFQSTYKRPYINSVPSVCQIDMQFVELDPPFDHNMKKRNVVTTSSSKLNGETNKKKNINVEKQNNLTRNQKAYLGNQVKIPDAVVSKELTDNQKLYLGRK